MQTSNERQKELYQVAEAQEGYFTAKQAASLGYASNKRAYHVQAGERCLGRRDGGREVADGECAASGGVDGPGAYGECSRATVGARKAAIRFITHASKCRDGRVKGINQNRRFPDF